MKVEGKNTFHSFGSNTSTDTSSKGAISGLVSCPRTLEHVAVGAGIESLTSN